MRLECVVPRHEVLPVAQAQHEPRVRENRSSRGVTNPPDVVRMKVGQRNDVDIFGTNAVPSKVIEQPTAGDYIRLFLWPEARIDEDVRRPGEQKTTEGQARLPVNAPEHLVTGRRVFDCTQECPGNLQEAIRQGDERPAPDVERGLGRARQWVVIEWVPLGSRHVTEPTQ